MGLFKRNANKTEAKVLDYIILLIPPAIAIAACIYSWTFAKDLNVVKIIYPYGLLSFANHTSGGNLLLSLFQYFFGVALIIVTFIVLKFLGYVNIIRAIFKFNIKLFFILTPIKASLLFLSFTMYPFTWFGIVYVILVGMLVAGMMSSNVFKTESERQSDFYKTIVGTNATVVKKPSPGLAKAYTLSLEEPRGRLVKAYAPGISPKNIRKGDEVSIIEYKKATKKIIFEPCKENIVEATRQEINDDLLIKTAQLKAGAKVSKLEKKIEKQLGSPEDERIKQLKSEAKYNLLEQKLNANTAIAGHKLDSRVKLSAYDADGGLNCKAKVIDAKYDVLEHTIDTTAKTVKNKIDDIQGVVNNSDTANLIGSRGTILKLPDASGTMGISINGNKYKACLSLGATGSQAFLNDTVIVQGIQNGMAVCTLDESQVQVPSASTPSLSGPMNINVQADNDHERRVIEQYNNTRQGLEAL